MCVEDIEMPRGKLNVVACRMLVSPQQSQMAGFGGVGG
jgi:hypothetical protein